MDVLSGGALHKLLEDFQRREMPSEVERVYRGLREHLSLVSSVSRFPEKKTIKMTSLLELLGNKNVRALLEAANEAPRSVTDLSEECDIGLTTTYRHVQRLNEHGLMSASSQLDEQGNHYQVYKTRFKAGFIYLEDKDICEDLCYSDDDADRLIWVWKQLRDQE